MTSNEMRRRYSSAGDGSVSSVDELKGLVVSGDDEDDEIRQRRRFSSNDGISVSSASSETNFQSAKFSTPIHSTTTKQAPDDKLQNNPHSFHHDDPLHHQELIQGDPQPSDFFTPRSSFSQNPDESENARRSHDSLEEEEDNASSTSALALATSSNSMATSGFISGGAGGTTMSTAAAGQQTFGSPTTSMQASLPSLPLDDAENSPNTSSTASNVASPALNHNASGEDKKHLSTSFFPLAFGRHASTSSLSTSAASAAGAAGAVAPRTLELKVMLLYGEDLVAMDKCGTSDPYVKFKLGSKTLFRSRTIYKVSFVITPGVAGVDCSL